MLAESVAVPLSAGVPAVDGAWWVPDNPKALLVFAHGAGAGHVHKTMQALVEAFAANGIGSLRFNFPYMQAGRRRVDNQDIAVAAIVDACRFARSAFPQLPLLAGGHSFGGRMTTHALVDQGDALADVNALILCSFPLHPPKKPSVQRAAHLGDVQRPMLFLSGTRDDLAGSELLCRVTDELAHARVHWLETANHSYVVLKRTRQNPLDVFEEIGQQAGLFLAEVL